MVMEDVHSARLSGKRIALTGRFASTTQEALAALVGDLGGEHMITVSRKTDMLVVGDSNGQAPQASQETQQYRRAQRLRALGYAIEIIGEEQFLAQLGLTERETTVQRRYTMAQLGRILSIPISRLRSWVRAGLVQPVEIVHRLALFDFSQVAAAKRLWELRAAGVPASQVRESLGRLRTKWPGVDRPLAQLSIEQFSGHLLVRLDDGRLAETDGQLRLDFDEQHSDPTAAPTRAVTAEDFFEEALALEDSGQLEAAVESYTQAIRLDPADPVLQFNAGNAFYQLGVLEKAAAHFAEAVRGDAAYVEAWNNLGTVLGELGRRSEAIEALEQAVRILPGYADAHFNLAESLSDAGRIDEACVHWRQYLAHDPVSPWADEVRTRLAEHAEKSRV